MSSAIACDEELARRLPLPLAQLYRHAHNAKSLLDLHQASYFLWEAALKLLGSVAVVVYAERASPDPQLCERLRNLARPAVGHWWEFVRLLTPILAESGDDGFSIIRDALTRKQRDDLPHAAGLHSILREVLDGHTGSRSTVRLSDLFDQLVRYRNKEIGHGALGRHSGDFYHRLGRSLLLGVSEMVGRLDFLAGRRLVYVAEVRRQLSGDWQAERYELIGETVRRLAPWTIAEPEACRMPLPERLYAETENATKSSALHPLLIYDAGSEKAFFLNARRGRQRTEYLCYTTGQSVEREQLFGEQRELLAQALGLTEVGEQQAAEWAALSRQEEEPFPDGSTPALREIGEFELLSKLGQGAMGIVYRARQPSLDREVALKCLLRSGEERAEARFTREIRALGRVQHPNLINIFTSGNHGEHYFYAMELVEGATLATVCEQLRGHKSSAAEVDPRTWQEGLSTACEETRRHEKPLVEGENTPLPRMVAESATVPAGTQGYVPQVAELMRQVAEAAHALHEEGIIHRDIKPGNIMVSTDGTRAVLLDLGLAQLADAMEGKLTRTRQFVGTLRYASPEQVLAVDRLDRRSDVYSLGATLWELLTLRPMYDATDETPTPEVMKRIQYAEPELPRKHHPGLAADLEAIVMKCLEKDANRRYATAKELADDLGRWQRGESVRAQPLTLRYRVKKFVRRQRRRILVTTAVILAQVALIFALLQFVPFRGEDSRKSQSAGNGSELVGESVGKRRALLVGCTKYGNIAKQFSLRGPGNDVELMRHVLVDHFQFSAADVVVLAEDESNDEKRPTRAHIEHAFRRLADIAEPGDQIVIYLSGLSDHQPVTTTLDGGKTESDDIENVFLPSDVEKRPEGKWIVRTAISGRQLSGWVKAILEKQASVWMILDTCNHRVNSLANLSGRSRIAGVPCLTWYRSPFDMPAEIPGLVIIYAVQPGEFATEKPLPADNSSRKVYGLFTYTLCEVLTSAPKAPTYSQLVWKVRTRLVAYGSPTGLPMIEGGDRNQFVLGGKLWPGRSPLLLSQDEEGQMHISGGLLHGLTQGSVLSLKRPVSEGFGERVLGHVRIVEPNLLDSKVELCPFAGLPVSSDSPIGAQCNPVYIDFISQCQPLHLAVSHNDYIEIGLAYRFLRKDDNTRKHLTMLEESLRALLKKESHPLVELVCSDEKAADFLFVLSKGYNDKKPNNPVVYLISKNNIHIPTRGLDNAPRDFEFDVWEPVVWLGPTPLSEIEEKWKGLLARIGVMRNLLVVIHSLEMYQTGLGSKLDMEVDLLKFQTWNDPEGQVLPWQSSSVSLSDGDWIEFRVTNRNPIDVDLTILFIDSTNLETIFPRGTIRNRLPSGKSIQTERVRIGSNGTPRLQHALILATAAEKSPIDFRFLTEPDFDKALRIEADRGTADRTINSPFGHLLQNMLYGRGEIRGLDIQTINRLAVRKLSWQVVPPRGIRPEGITR